MVEVIREESPSQRVAFAYPAWGIAVCGVTLGVLWWCLMAFFGHFIVDQSLCRSTSTLASCSTSYNLSGGMATIAIALIGLGLMVRLHIFRPILVVTAAAIVLWGLASWTHGLGTWETIAWSALLYGVTYMLFTWIARYRRTIPVLLMMVLGIVIIHIAGAA